MLKYNPQTGQHEDDGLVECVHEGCGREYDPAKSTAPRPRDWCSAECQQLSFGK
jgi:hypothetical protein